MTAFSTSVVEEDLDRIIGSGIEWERLRGATVAITGATGMVGGYLVFALLRANSALGLDLRVVAIARDSRKITRTFGDQLQRDDLTAVLHDVSLPMYDLERADFVIHAASQASPKYFSSDPVGTIRANTVGTFNTLDYAVRSDSTRYLFVSTREVYGEPTPGQADFVEEDWGHVNSIDPRSSYSEGKRAAETITTSYRAQYGVDTRIARLSHTYGPGMTSDDGRVQALFLSDVLAGRDIVLRSSGRLTRTYTYAADAASAILYILLNGPDPVYNIADNDSLVSIRELAETFNSARDGSSNAVVRIAEDVEADSGWSPVTAGNVNGSRLRSIGWRPTFSLAEGVSRWVRHAREAAAE